MEYFEKIHVRVNVQELKMVTITVFNTFVFVFEFNTSSANTMITIKYISASMTYKTLSKFLHLNVPT